MTFKCSECGGDLKLKKEGNQTIITCLKCGRRRQIKDNNTETIDMSETADLQVLME